MLRPVDPYSKPEILEAADNLHTDLAVFFRGIEPQVFFAQPGAGWSVAENLKHLIKVGVAVNLGLATPPVLLAVLGASREAARRLSEVRNDYLARLSAGATAGIIYRPGRETLAGRTSGQGERQEALVAKWVRTGQRFAKILSAWSEEDLDRCRMPHPIMGRVPVREMCMFTLLHALHHAGNVERRLRAAKGG